MKSIFKLLGIIPLVILIGLSFIACGDSGGGGDDDGDDGDIVGWTTGTSDYSWYNGKSSPYSIGTPEELLGFANLVNDGTDDFSPNKIVNLIANLDLENKEWTPIGNSINNFKGIFDGKGYKIIGVSITGNSNSVGLFGSINAKVQNLGVSGNISGGSAVGGVAGSNGAGEIINCYYTGEVTGTSQVGGVIGYSNNNVLNCYNLASVNGTGTDVGGVVGYSNFGSVENCYNVGSVTGSTDVGGVVGKKFSDDVINCYNISMVTGNGNYAGGVVGYNNSFATTKNCLSLGLIVTGNSDVGRVSGTDYNISDNKARSDMKVGTIGSEVTVPFASTGDTTIHGVNVSLGDSLSAVFDSTWISSVWNISSGNLIVGGALPTLKDMPGRQQDPKLP